MLHPLLLLFHGECLFLVIRLFPSYPPVPSVKPENDLEKRHSSRPCRSRLANTPCLRSCTKPFSVLKHTGGPVFLFIYFFAFHAASPLLHSARQQALSARSKNDDPFSTHYIFLFFFFTGKNTGVIETANTSPPLGPLVLF